MSADFFRTSLRNMMEYDELISCLTWGQTHRTDNTWWFISKLNCMRSPHDMLTVNDTLAFHHWIILMKVCVHATKYRHYGAAEHLTCQCHSLVQLIFKHRDHISEASGNCAVINLWSKCFFKKCVVKSTMWSVVMAVSVQPAYATAQSDVNTEQLLEKQVKKWNRVVYVTAWRKSL